MCRAAGAVLQGSLCAHEGIVLGEHDRSPTSSLRLEFSAACFCYRGHLVTAKLAQAIRDSKMGMSIIPSAGRPSRSVGKHMKILNRTPHAGGEPALGAAAGAGRAVPAAHAAAAAAQVCLPHDARWPALQRLRPEGPGCARLQVGPNKLIRNTSSSPERTAVSQGVLESRSVYCLQPKRISSPWGAAWAMMQASILFPYVVSAGLLRLHAKQSHMLLSHLC